MEQNVQEIRPHTTRLIITPHITLVEYTSDNHDSVDVTKDELKEIPKPKIG
ncbi:hypothetical protein J2Z66_003757 [Paenibacillus eucommiae]|uniref:Uncharacterized protein n=1 Tax=Paenibacillus eucommiae TaxID=1355755 RepID=A0ABS4IX50_9BACL|nr:hypothetical protein [Paenibacillus eucommiae]